MEVWSYPGTPEVNGDLSGVNHGLPLCAAVNSIVVRNNISGESQIFYRLKIKSHHHIYPLTILRPMPGPTWSPKPPKNQHRVF